MTWPRRSANQDHRGLAGDLAEVARLPLKRVRLHARLPRLAFVATAAVLTATGLRATFAPIVATRSTVAPLAIQDDRPAEAFAEAFARAYLTWDAADPERHRAELTPFLPRDFDPDAGLEIPQAGRQTVRWTAVSGDVRSVGGRLVTVLAETSNGPLRLDIEVVRDRRGFISLGGYPAVVGPPPIAH